MYSCFWVLTHLLSCVLATVSIGVNSLTSSSISIPTAATCYFQTTNYITHTLPQQCLTTSRGLSGTQSQEILHSSFIGRSESASTSSLSKAVQITISNATPTVASTTPTISISTSIVLDPSVSNQSTPEHHALANLPRTLEEDSALESGNFLSFEEWKKQNLKKAGQSEHVVKGAQAEFQEPRKRPTNVQNALDSLGDDTEIDIDFTGFVPGGPGKPAHEVMYPIAELPEQEQTEPRGAPWARSRSKDAGTTSKERFNYASFDCAANILRTNREAKSPNSVLLENKDSYMLNQCAAKEKFIILELCNDIQIDTIVLANFEFFSSTFRTFRVSVSDRYPVKIEKWKILGVYEARNTREVQAFLVENPVIWARYVRIEFLTHYGQEFYCPVSLLRVHGTTMMEEYKHDMDVGIEDENDEIQLEQEEDLSLINSLTPQSVAKTLDRTESVVPEASYTTEHLHDSTNNIQETTNIEKISRNVTEVVPASVIAFEAIMSVVGPSDVCVPADGPTSLSLPQKVSTSRAISSIASTAGDSKEHVQPANTHDEAQHLTSVEPTSSIALSSSSSSVSSSTISSTGRPAMNSAASSVKDKLSTSASDKPRQSSTPAQVPPAMPTIQESFFKSVQKRLQMLEANSSLSLQYIEDQSRALRDAFKKVEQRQLTKTTTFLDVLNTTVLNELRDFRQQYDQLWQSTIIELQIQRDRYERDNEAINARLGILADEVIFQRRMGILQMVLILVCLMLVLFSRGAINNYLELPIVQNVLSRSPNSKWLNLSSNDPTIRPGQSSRARSAHQVRTGVLKGHRRIQSEDSITDMHSGPEAYAPPTPVSYDAQSEADDFKDETKSPISDFEKDDDRNFDDPEFDPNTIQRPSTSPPVLRINNLSPVSEAQGISDDEILHVQAVEEASQILNGTLSPHFQVDDTNLSSKHLIWDLPTS